MGKEAVINYGGSGFTGRGDGFGVVDKGRRCKHGVLAACILCFMLALAACRGGGKQPELPVGADGRSLPLCGDVSSTAVCAEVAAGGTNIQCANLNEEGTKYDTKTVNLHSSISGGQTSVSTHVGGVGLLGGEWGGPYDCGVLPTNSLATTISGEGGGVAPVYTPAVIPGAIEAANCKTAVSGDTAFGIVTRDLPVGSRAYADPGYDDDLVTVTRPDVNVPVYDRAPLLTAGQILAGDKVCLVARNGQISGGVAVATVESGAPTLIPTSENPIPPDGYRCSTADHIVGAKQELYPNNPNDTLPVTIFDKTGTPVGGIVYRTMREFYAHNPTGSLGDNVACTNQEFPNTPEPPGVIPTPIVTPEA